MSATLTNYMESVLNPGSCFRTLDGIFCRRDENDDPLFVVSEYEVKFEMEWKGRIYRLICFLDDSAAIHNKMRLLLSDPDIRKCPHLPRTEYLDGELLVFGDDGTCNRHDVILQEIGEGAKLDKLLLESSLSDDNHTPHQLLSALLEMSRWLYAHRLVHEHIRLQNLMVKQDQSMVLINFETTRKVTECETCSARDPFGADNLAIAELAVLLCITSCNPSAYGMLRQNILHRQPNLKKILPELSMRAKELGLDALYELTDMLRRANGKLRDRTLLNHKIEDLIATRRPVQDERMREILLTPIQKAKEKTPDPILRRMTYPEISDTEDFVQYDWKGDLYDTLIRVEQNGKYFYTDRYGKRVNDKEYDQAYDYYEGRAVVTVGESSALIDHEGNEVIPFICEDLEWDPFTGTAKVMIDGKWGLFDRCGQVLAPTRYDWMGSSGSGLIVAQLDNSYGFIRRDGTVAIPFIYDDAFGFDRGTAIVSLGGENFSIDPLGNRIAGETPENGRNSIREIVQPSPVKK